MIQINDSGGARRTLCSHPDEENPSMKPVTTSLVATVLAALTLSSGAMAQTAYDDAACRQYADQAVAPIRDQANSQAVGSTLLGAGLGAALGGAIGGGRGAGIGAASGAFAGAAGGAANSAEASGYIQQQYNAYYAQCMSTRAPRPPAYAAPGYPQQPSSANQLNQQQYQQQQYQQPYQQPYPYR
jgi:uncharacterized protein YcfJ